MTLEQFRTALEQSKDVNFYLQNSEPIPTHAHLTEVGLVQKHFIDCGGTVRTQQNISMQLWLGTDLDHKLTAEKLIKIIDIAINTLQLPNAEIEVEYQSHSIVKYALEGNRGRFTLINTATACLAEDSCGLPSTKQKISMASLAEQSSSCCTPGGGCC
jgi:hypothetical protein